ncbi:hypothetical protein C7999DRAFT_43147 [Corynascus novoguineensis]|uniref:Uncharacterized protein n=1 Tax=Corynascus novoguineensis TaxID=1126955 RepID=A0AAN7CND4_9PEZI|nr:hypothetical protein C7999DRAFT_43147 [Corynascus novoguineensis]
MELMRREAKTTDNAACQCYVNTTEIQKGRGPEDPRECLTNCKAQFMKSVLEGWDVSNGWADGCASLNRGVKVQEFWSLYWCDSTFCGVAINQEGGLGQDPSVDLIINTCHNIGFWGIIDPGPPPPSFRCITEADTVSICSATVTPTSQTQTTPGRQTDAGGLSTSVGINTQATTTAHLSSTPTVLSLHPESTVSVATVSSAPSPSSTTTGSSLTGQGKAAIAICSVLAVILLLSILFSWLRHRNRRNESFHRGLRFRQGIPQDTGATSSPTPLITPVTSALGTRTPLTPPLRLRDRKFLPSILRPGSRSPSPPLTPLTPAHGLQPGGVGGAGPSRLFPSSPICSPTINKLTPRQERSTLASTPRIYTNQPHSSRPSSSLSRTAATPVLEDHRRQGSTSLVFTQPIPVAGSFGSGTRPLSRGADNTNTNTITNTITNTNTNNNRYKPNRGSDGRSVSSSSGSCYTADGNGDGGAAPPPPPSLSSSIATATATAHSSLRHEISIVAAPFVLGAGTGTGTGMRGATGWRDATPPPSRRMHGLPPPPPSHQSYSPAPSPSPSHSWSSSVAGFRRDGSVSTSPPPPPPPLSPPPTRALPQTPRVTRADADVSPPPPSQGRSAPLTHPPHGSASRGTPVEDCGKGNPAPGISGMSRMRSPVLSAGEGSGVTAAFPASYRRQFAEVGVRESWGSWSGSGSYQHHGARDADAMAASEREDGADAVSPRTSGSSGATARGNTVASAVSRMSSVRDGTGDGVI